MDLLFSSPRDGECLNSREQEKLRGKTVAIKDSIAVAGVPMTCGNSSLKVNLEINKNSWSLCKEHIMLQSKIK